MTLVRYKMFLRIAVICTISFLLPSFLLVKEYPKDYFRSPVGNRILLSGTFGELRSNHFHAGIDIKGAIGQSLFATADGYVARIKVQSGGYGKTLYIRHPNGFTSVYAHLKKFADPIEKFVTRFQNEKKQFEVEIFPQAGQFSFKKGEQVGQMGVSGRSFGPHLHFEIRDSKTEKPINPLLFGIPVRDDIAPRLHLLKVYALNPKHETLSTASFDLIKKGRAYTIRGDTLEIGAWRVGLGLKAYDHMNGASNWNGIYGLEVRVDKELTFDFDMETFAFSETRFLNAHIDYAEQVTDKSYINRCYRLPGNRLSIYNRHVREGVITLSSTKAKMVEITATDVEGNTSNLIFWIKRKEVTKPQQQPVFNYLLPYQEENIIKTPGLNLYFPKGTLYQDLYLQYSAARESTDDFFSAVHHIHASTVPVHRYFDISIKADAIPAGLREKAFIAYCEKDNAYTNCGGKWQNGFLKSRARALGDYCIMVDDQAPTIQPIAFRADMRGYNKMTFKIRDNFNTAGNVRGLSYRATIDGQWVLMEYDAKNDLLIHRFDGKFGSGEHRLLLEVWDSLNNRKTLERKFRI